MVWTTGRWRGCLVVAVMVLALSALPAQAGSCPRKSGAGNSGAACSPEIKVDQSAQQSMELGFELSSLMGQTAKGDGGAASAFGLSLGGGRDSLTRNLSSCYARSMFGPADCAQIKAGMAQVIQGLAWPRS